MMTEDQKRTWDVIIGVFGPIITATALVFSVWQFNYTERHRAEFEHNAKLWESRISAYQEIATRAGKVVAYANTLDFKRYASEFSEIYYGPSLLSEDREVQAQMVLFKIEINNYKDRLSGKDQLLIRANSLIRSCRNSAKIASEEAIKDIT